jgi:aminoglycoside phosphotransferase (APT) family kinase protein
MKLESLEAYLRYRLPEEKHLEVRSAIKFPRGSSRETWIVESDGIDPELQTLVFRRDFVAGSICPADLRLEYEIYNRLVPSEVPVAAPLWFEEDPDWFIDGREFYVRRHVVGSWDVPHFLDFDPAYDDLKVDVSKEHLRKLALIHTCHWEALGFGEIMDVPESPKTSAAQAVDRIVADLDRFSLEPYLVVTEAAEWLRDNAPEPTPHVGLCKGTNGLGEEIFVDGEIVAMSDWELACIGDPAYDFAQLQAFIPVVSGRWDENRALEYYEEVSGIHIEPATIAYYRLLYSLISVMYTHNAARMIADGDRLARLCWVATQVNLFARTSLGTTCGILPA